MNKSLIPFRPIVIAVAVLLALSPPGTAVDNGTFEGPLAGNWRKIEAGPGGCVGPARVATRLAPLNLAGYIGPRGGAAACKYNELLQFFDCPGAQPNPWCAVGIPYILVLEPGETVWMVVNHGVGAGVNTGFKRTNGGAARIVLSGAISIYTPGCDVRRLSIIVRSPGAAVTSRLFVDNVVCQCIDESVVPPPDVPAGWEEIMSTGDMPSEYDSSAGGDELAPVDALGSDCNCNGVEDIYDIVEGASLDLNNDAVPDECVGATVSHYNGSNINLDTLSASKVVIGSAWTATLSPQGARGPGAWMILLRAAPAPVPIPLDLGTLLALPPAGLSELLVGGSVITNFNGPPHPGGGGAATFSASVPSFCALVGNPWFAQAIVLGDLPTGGGIFDPWFSSAANGVIGSF